MVWLNILWLYTQQWYITGSWGRKLSNFLRIGHTDIQSDCTRLHYHQQWRSIPITQHPLKHKVSSVFLFLAILTGVKWNLRIILICIYLMAKDVEYFLNCLSAIWDSCVESYLFKSLPHFCFWIIYLWMPGFLSSLYILEISPLSDVGLMKIFFQQSNFLITVFVSQICVCLNLYPKSSFILMGSG